MLYALLAYHEEHEIRALSEDEDAALMAELEGVHGRWTADGRLGPAARLGSVARAATVRGPGRGVVVDGPFAETKEQLLGLYVIEAENLAAAIEHARDLKAANPSAVYEVRPIVLYRPGAAFPLTDAGLADVRP